LLRDLQEIWTQNSINGGTNRASTVRAVIKGESITAFETSLQDERTNNEGEEQQAMTSAHVDSALTAVATTVFPHRALEIQKLWMKSRMFKPTELTTDHLEDLTSLARTPDFCLRDILTTGR
jgi:hypothetical protein